jgi:hypothetical protein
MGLRRTPKAECTAVGCRVGWRETYLPSRAGDGQQQQRCYSFGSCCNGGCFWGCAGRESGAEAALGLGGGQWRPSRVYISRFSSMKYILSSVDYSCLCLSVGLSKSLYSLESFGLRLLFLLSFVTSRSDNPRTASLAGSFPSWCCISLYMIVRSFTVSYHKKVFNSIHTS